jgi:LmbE family N-acetylglucosaminyl deacetylase
MAKVEVFLFAHPDDEFGAFFSLEQATGRGAEVLCLYLTDGAFRSPAIHRREAESRGVLRRLGVRNEAIHFIGAREGFQDGGLCRRLTSALAVLSRILDRLPVIDAIHMHAWEGGHQDHDAVHLLGVAYAARRGLLGVCRQFSLYRVGGAPLNLALCEPLAENGPIDARPIPWPARLRYLKLCLSYPSQWRTFAALLPLLALRYASKGVLETQGVSLARIFERPHQGPLLYERRGRETYEAFRDQSRPLLESLSRLAAQAGPR